jgi:hypothetical protein
VGLPWRRLGAEQVRISERPQGSVAPWTPDAAGAWPRLMIRGRHRRAGTELAEHGGVRFVSDVVGAESGGSFLAVGGGEPQRRKRARDDRTRLTLSMNGQEGVVSVRIAHSGRCARPRGARR